MCPFVFFTQRLNSLFAPKKPFFSPVLVLSLSFLQAVLQFLDLLIQTELLQLFVRPLHGALLHLLLALLQQGRQDGRGGRGALIHGQKKRKQLLLGKRIHGLENDYYMYSNVSWLEWVFQTFLLNSNDHQGPVWWPQRLMFNALDCKQSTAERNVIINQKWY